MQTMLFSPNGSRQQRDSDFFVGREITFGLTGGVNLNRLIQVS